LWDVLRRWPSRKIPKVRRILFVDIAFIAMTLWLLMLSQSATSRLCFVIGCVVVSLVHYGPGMIRRNIKPMVPIAVFVAVLLEFTFDISGVIAQIMGRDPTLTGRTEIWAAVLNVDINPLLGAGFASFWLGDRVAWLWEVTDLVGLGNAHNGYLETYLELGIVGLCLLCGVLIGSFRTICRRDTTSLDFFSFSLALWTILIVYNLTESGFRGNPVWITFLLVGIAVPTSRNAAKNNRGAAPDAAGNRRFARPSHRP
jgi:O-antigen ligase